MEPAPLRPPRGKQKVCYFHDADTMGTFYYGPGHPMKPHRLQMTHNLILSYQLYKKMEVYRPHLATEEEMTQFHAADNIDFIKRVTPDNQHEFAKQLQRFTVGDDCPVFDGLHDYCRVYTARSPGATPAHRRSARAPAPLARVLTCRSRRRAARSTAR